ncbi:MAG: putative toxin-antitoxin system toxin component, PIN family [Clostridia bacterium]|nr:putative toxin-antitoxin system toxin component, PIN family [Clostridia bacterium]
MRYYTVFDTNVLVSSLLTKHPDSPTARVVDAIADGRIVPLYSEEILSEYDEVLHRRKFPFSTQRIMALLSMICQYGIAVSPSPTHAVLPDADDIVFYEVVMEKRKEDDAYLITGNQRHFPVCDFIVTPADMMALLEQH